MFVSLDIDGTQAYKVKLSSEKDSTGARHLYDNLQDAESLHYFLVKFMAWSKFVHLYIIGVKSFSLFIESEEGEEGYIIDVDAMLKPIRSKIEEHFHDCIKRHQEEMAKSKGWEQEKEQPEVTPADLLGDAEVTSSTQ